MKDASTGLKTALLILLIIFGYLFAITFNVMPRAGQEQAKTISPFLLGVVATLIGFYWGNSKKKDYPPENTPVDDAAINAAKIEAEKAVEEKK
jgi:hypothetical protein